MNGRLLGAAEKIAGRFTTAPTIQDIQFVAEILEGISQPEVSPTPTEDPVRGVLKEGTPSLFAGQPCVRVLCNDGEPWTYVADGLKYRIYMDMDWLRVFVTALKDRDVARAEAIWGQLTLEQMMAATGYPLYPMLFPDDGVPGDSFIYEWLRQRGVLPMQGLTVPEIVAFQKQFNPAAVDGSGFQNETV